MTPTPNRALWRAAHSLTHPAIVAAVIGLLINDHWLRYAYPSWLTGKLGDFTWLIFAPLIAAICFALVIPRRIEPHTRLVGWLSFGSVGLWFAAAKTIPAVHTLTAAAWSALVGWPGSLRLDPTDLLALPGLLIGAWVWSRADDTPLNLRPLAYVIAALGLVGTLASNDSPEFRKTGIVCLFQQGDALVTVEGLEAWNARSPTPSANHYEPTVTRWNVYTSRDGGLNWTWYAERRQEGVDYPTCAPTTSFVQPHDPAIQYRWEPGESIERSIDGGRTWVLDYDLAPLGQDVRVHYNHLTSSYRVYDPGPLNAAFDPATGHLVLAMGQDGVLVRTPDGTWHWVTVGEYELADLQNLRKLRDILFFEWWQAGALVLLVAITTVAWNRTRYGNHARWLKAEIGWTAWGVVSLLLISFHRNYEMVILVGPVSLIILVMAIPLSIDALWDIALNLRPQAWTIFLHGFGVAGLYLLPLILWTQGTIPRYTTALFFALLLVAAGLYATYNNFKPPPPELPPSTEDEAVP